MTQREWVGGRVTFPAPIASMGDRLAELVLWIELPDLAIVGHAVEDPRDPSASFGQTLMRAMSSPLVGPPRRPERVRVADASLARELEALSFLKVEVAPTPELDAVLRSMGAYMGKGSYFSDPSLTAKELERLFVAARVLWAMKPWQTASDDCLLRIDIPALGIEEAAVSVVGALGDVRGFILFPSVEGWRLMMDTAKQWESDGPPAGHSALNFSFDARDEVPSPMRDEVASHGWPLAAEDAYPVLMRFMDGKKAPVMRDDVRVVTAVARALAAFTLRHPSVFEKFGTVEISESQFDEHHVEVIVTVPHPRQLATERRGTKVRTQVTDRNPYGLPLPDDQIAQLKRLLGACPIERVLGMFCAVASAPQLISPTQWFAEIAHEARFADESALQAAIGLLMPTYHHVLDALDLGEIDDFVPLASAELECREWARGHASMLRFVDPAKLLSPDLIESAMAIQAVAEIPQVLELLEETRGDRERDEWLADYRAKLATHAATMFEGWAEERSKPAPATYQRELPKVGRNDPCPCGSGKKHKKCCGAVQ